MVEANLNKAHHIVTYLSSLFLPIILSWLLTKLVETSHDLTRCWEWNHVCLGVCHYPQEALQEKEGKMTKQDQGPSPEEEVPYAQLPSTACPDCLQSWLSCQTLLTLPPGSPQHQPVHAQNRRLCASTTLPYQVPRIRFDTNSFIIGIDTFASITLGNHPDQFEDLRMHNNVEVEGIQGGLGIKGTGKFKFHIEDDEGGIHLIKISSSKYVPDLKVYLLLPHHLAQEAKEGKGPLPCPKGNQDGYRRQGADPHLETAKIPTDHSLPSTYQHSFLPHRSGITYLPCLCGTV